MRRHLDNHRPLADSSSYSDDKAYCITTGHQYQWKIVDGVMYRTCALCGDLKAVRHIPEPKEEE